MPRRTRPPPRRPRWKRRACSVSYTHLDVYKRQAAIEVGTSIRVVSDVDSLDRIIDIILHIDNVIATVDDKHRIPVFMRVKDKAKIQQLDERLNAAIEEEPEIHISELDIIGATEIFNHNDCEFVLKYKRNEKPVTSLSHEELHAFCDDFGLDFATEVLNITVISLYEGNQVDSAKVKKLIDFTCDTEQCLLSKGIWYQYNDCLLYTSINALKGKRRYYVAAYPFYNTQNSQMYSLIHCTSNPVGFELYKKTAWQTFENHSSNKNTHGHENQLMLDFNGSGKITTQTDESCFTVLDIAKYIHYCFKGQRDVPLEEVYNSLKAHPVFPADGYRSQIRDYLKSDFGAEIKFVKDPVTGKKETRVSFAEGKFNYE